MRTKNLNHVFKASVLAATLAAMPALVHSAGLGKVTVLSALGQPLRAEVDLTATSEELASLKAQMASADSFLQAGVEFVPTVAQIRVSVEKRSGGRPYLRLSTERPVNDPFLDLLLEVSWAQGRLLREYTFLLDPAPDAIALKPIATPPAGAPQTASTVASGARSIPQEAAASPDAGAIHEEASSYQVKKGDTLAKIAAQHMHEGVSLDQMLVALFNANQDAFIGRNMNRMMAGKILDIPDASAAEAVSATQARRIVVAQSADFNAYRRKLATAAAAAPAPEEEAAQQTASGQITAKVEEKAPVASEGKDQLKVSRADPAQDRGASGRVRALEEEVVAREKALQEANARLTELEKNVRDLQRLVELKNQSLAELQKQAAAASGPAPEAKSEPIESGKIDPPILPIAEKPAEHGSAAAQPPEAAAKPATEERAVPPLAASAPAEPLKPVQPAPPEPAKPAALPQPTAETSFVADLAGNPLVLGGGAAVLGLIGLLAYRRRQQGSVQPATESAPTTTAASLATNSVFGNTGGRSVDTSSSSLQTDFSQASISAIDADEGVDPVAEADVYMAYGRDAQAEEILLDALKTDPTRTAIYAKLLEIYAARRNVKQFETLARELYARSGGTGSDWEKAAALGLKLDPLNPLYSGKPAEQAPPVAAAPAGAEATVVMSSPEKLKDTWTMPGELAQIAQAVEAETPDPVTATVVLEQANTEAASLPVVSLEALDFDLDLSKPETGGEPEKPRDSVVSSIPQTTLDIDLELDFPASGERKRMDDVEPESVSTTPAAVEFDLTEDESVAQSPRSSPEVHESSAPEETPVPPLPDFDFDPGSPGVPENLPQPEIDFSAIDLNLEAPALKEATVGEDDQEVATKLELAKAYEEMGDREGARELLQEVVKEGDVEQRQKARDLLEALV